MLLVNNCDIKSLADWLFSKEYAAGPIPAYRSNFRGIGLDLILFISHKNASIVERLNASLPMKKCGFDYHYPLLNVPLTTHVNILNPRMAGWERS